MTAATIGDIDYPRTVSVSRPGTGFGESGDYDAAPTVIVAAMTADIQLSLAIRDYLSEDGSGTSDHRAWTMYCQPPVPLKAGDIVGDGDETFVIDAVGDWGSHVECTLRLT